MPPSSTRAIARRSRAAVHGPVVVVCTHGRRDVCCAERGRPLAAATALEHPGAVWESTHVGGDRFAGEPDRVPARPRLRPGGARTGRGGRRRLHRGSHRARPLSRADEPPDARTGRRGRGAPALGARSHRRRASARRGAPRATSRPFAWPSHGGEALVTVSRELAAPDATHVCLELGGGCRQPGRSIGSMPTSRAADSARHVLLVLTRHRSDLFERVRFGRVVGNAVGQVDLARPRGSASTGASWSSASASGTGSAVSSSCLVAHVFLLVVARWGPRLRTLLPGYSPQHHPMNMRRSGP